MKSDTDWPGVLLFYKVVGEFLSGEVTLELTPEGQEEAAMERARTRARRAEGTGRPAAQAAGEMGGPEC